MLEKYIFGNIIIKYAGEDVKQLSMPSYSLLLWYVFVKYDSKQFWIPFGFRERGKFQTQCEVQTWSGAR